MVRIYIRTYCKVKEKKYKKWWHFPETLLAEVKNQFCGAQLDDYLLDDGDIQTAKGKRKLILFDTICPCRLPDPPTTTRVRSNISCTFVLLQSRLTVPWWLQQKWMLLLLDNGHQMSIMSIEFLERRQHTFPITASVMIEYKLWRFKFS
jgi:hypothetical protein